MKKFIFPLVLTLLLVAVLISACSGGTAGPAAKSRDKILIGMSRSLSGPLAQIGDSAFRPIYETIVTEWNAQGGINAGGKMM